MRPFRERPPTSTRPSVERPRLLALLRSRFDRRVISVVAGPGFGKTTLLAQALVDNRGDRGGIDVWVGCSRDDREGAPLAESLLRALGATLPLDADPLVQVCEAVWQRAPKEVALVLDDVHEIAAGSPGARLLAALVKDLPANGHLVVSSRQAPPLPLIRLVARDEALEIGESDLAFDAGEMDAFASLRAVPPASLEAAAGWPALAELQASAGRSHVRGFLWEEVLSDLSDDHRRALALMAAVGEMDQGLFEAVTGLTVPIETVVGRLPLVDRGEAVWKLHGLWTDQLADRLEEADRSAGRLRAARALRSRGDVVAAFRLASEENDWDEAFAAVRATTLLPDPLPGDVLARWEHAVPADRRTEPDAALLRGLALQASHPRLAIPAFSEAERGYVERGDLDGASVAATRALALHVWSGQIDELVAALFRISGYGDPGLRPTDAKASAFVGNALALWAGGAPDEALAFLSDVPADASAGLRAAACTIGALAHLARGTPGEGIAVAAAGQAVLSAPSGLLDSIALLLRWYAGELSDAQAALDATLPGIEALGDTTVSAMFGLSAAQVALVRGDPDMAAAHLRNVPSDQDGPLAGIGALRCLVESWRLVCSGQEEAAASMLSEEVALRPLDDPGGTGVRGGSMALLYVLCPQVRPFLDAAALGPTWALARDLGRSVAALRDGTRVDPVEAAWGQAAQILVLVPLPWAAELAVGALQAGHVEECVELLDAIGTPARSLVRTIAESRHPLAERARGLLATIPSPPAAHVRIAAMGSLGLVRQGLPVDDQRLRRGRVRALLGLLVSERDLSRDRVVAELWPDLDPVSARRNLRVTLTWLQQALEPDREEGEAPYFVRATRERLALGRVPELSVDAWELEAALDAAQRAEQAAHPSDAVEFNRRAVELYAGDFLRDEDGEWAVAARERLRRQVVAAALRAADLELARGNLEETVRLAEWTRAVDRWAEPAYRIHAQACLRAGNPAAALRVLQDCEDALGELGARPSADTERLRHLATAGAPA